MKKDSFYRWLVPVLLLCFFVQSYCFAEAEQDGLHRIPDEKEFTSCWGTDGAIAVIRPSGPRFEVIIETYDCGPDSSVYAYFCDYREEDGALEARNTGRKRVIGWDEAQEQEFVQTEYEDGAAVFQINADGLLVWNDLKENAGENLLFFRMGDFEGIWVSGGITIDFYPVGGLYDCRIKDNDNDCSWRYFCNYDSQTNSVMSSSDGWKELHDQTERVYDDGIAVFRILEDGSLQWEDKKENAGKDLVFIRVESRWTSALLH